jgi:hypothetical protein
METSACLKGSGFTRFVNASLCRRFLQFKWNCENFDMKHRQATLADPRFGLLVAGDLISLCKQPWALILEVTDASIAIITNG